MTRHLEGLEIRELPELAGSPAWSARLTSRPGPPAPLLIAHQDTSVVALPGRYCMSYIIVVGDTAALVDVGSCEDIPRFRRALKGLQPSSPRIAFVLATHLHFDHVMGLDEAARVFETEVALGLASRRAVDDGIPIRWPGRMGTLRAIPGWVMQGMPTITPADRAHGRDFGFPWSKNRFTSPLGHVLEHRRPLPGLDGWTVLAAPGHSSDSICLHHERAGILIAGDSVRNFRGGEWNALLDDAARYEHTKQMLRGLHVRVVCPGHGPVLVGDSVLSTLSSLGLLGNRLAKAQTT